MASDLAGSRRGILAPLTGVALAALVLALTAGRLGWGELGGALRRADVAPLVVALALNVPIAGLRALRAGALLRHLGAGVGAGLLFSSQLVGQTLSWITPGAGGDLWRAVMWERREGVSLARGVVTVAAERVLSLALIGGVGLLLAAPVLASGAAAGALGLLGCGVAASPWLVAALSRGWCPRRLVERLLALPPLRRRAAVLRASGADLRSLLGSRRVGALVVATTLGVIALSGVQVVLVVRSLGGSVSLAGGAAASCLSQAAGSLSALPFGIGATDLSLIAVLARLGSGGAIAAGAAVLLRATVTLPLTAAAAVLLGVRREAAPLGGSRRVAGAATGEAEPRG